MTIQIILLFFFVYAGMNVVSIAGKKYVAHVSGILLLIYHWSNWLCFGFYFTYKTAYLSLIEKSKENTKSK